MLMCFSNSRRGTATIHAKAATISFSTSGGAATNRERHLIEQILYIVNEYSWQASSTNGE